MDVTELLTSTHVQKSSQQPCALLARALGEVAFNPCEVEVVVVNVIVPIVPACLRARRSRGGRWWWRRAGELLIEVGRRRAHARRRWPSGVRLRNLDVDIMCCQ